MWKQGAFAFVAMALVVALIGMDGIGGNTYVLLAVFVVLGAAFIVSFLMRPAGRGGDGFETLVALCRNDRAMAERLVAGEERRNPTRDRRVHIARAIERLRDDRRR